jgi:pSer/pThr/pTyr-binding forkhead associated (FHA) protein
MAKLVVTTEGFGGRVLEVSSEKVTVGRLDDNKFCLAEPSVSSHHCELVLKGDEILVKDLNSTNGTYINGEQTKEGTLKPGQTLRLGVVELKYETGKKQADQPRPSGVKIEPATNKTPPPIEKNAAFGKKNNKINKIFIGIGALLAIVIIVFLVIAFSGVNGGGAGQ